MTRSHLLEIKLKFKCEPIINIAIAPPCLGDAKMKDLITMWVLSVAIATLSAINTICWGFAIREIGDPQLSINFIFKLLFNRFFIMAMVSALLATLLSYVVLSSMGVLAGRFFLSLQAVATVIVCTLVLGERLTLSGWIGVILIIAGVLLIGGW